MTWAQRLKRVFNIDIETCEHCGGSVKIIAGIEDLVIRAAIADVACPPWRDDLTFDEPWPGHPWPGVRRHDVTLCGDDDGMSDRPAHEHTTEWMHIQHPECTQDAFWERSMPRHSPSPPQRARTLGSLFQFFDCR